MQNLYGEYSPTQIAQTKKSLRGSIFFLLLCVDPKTSHDYTNVDVNVCFESTLLKINGLNKLLFEPVEIVTTMSLLQSALMEYNKSDFDFYIYRKLILDAGAEIAKIKEV